MKVKCQNCGKSFIYEKNSGICNHCGRYMPVPVSSVQKEKEQKEYLNESIYTYKSEQKAYKKRKNEKWTKVQKISCSIIGAVMAALLIIVVSVTKRQAAYNSSLREVGIIEKTEAAMNEEISLDSRTLKIKECGIKEEWNSQVPKGYQLVYIEYEMKNELQCYSGLHTDIYMKLYPMTYIEPINGYRLADELEMEGQEYGIYDELREEGGQILFLVPKQVKNADFNIYYYTDSEGDSTKHGTYVLKTVYEIPVSWEEK